MVTEQQVIEWLYHQVANERTAISKAMPFTEKPGIEGTLAMNTIAIAQRKIGYLHQVIAIALDEKHDKALAKLTSE